MTNCLESCQAVLTKYVMYRLASAFVGRRAIEFDPAKKIKKIPLCCGLVLIQLILVTANALNIYYIFSILPFTTFGCLSI